MANSIDSVKLLQKEIDVIIRQLKDTQEEVVNISKLARDLSSVFSGVKTPNELNDTLKTSSSNTEQLNALIKEQNSLERKLISTIAKKTLAQESTAKAVAKENEQLKVLKKEQRTQLKAVSELSTAYEKVNAQLNLQIREYQNLSVLQKQGNKLTVEQKKRYDELAVSIKSNQKVLKDTDAEVGRFQRNVGNYASGFDGLSNSINQLTREAPAFTNSVQTGFLALSNNIPILADEIGRLSAKNKELAASGKPTKSVFTSLVGALFSWQTAMSLGITLLTVYGKEIGEFIKKVSNGGDKVRDLAKNQKILNSTYKEAAKGASEEISKLQLLLSVASDKTKSDKLRKKAVDKLIKSSGGLIKEQDRLNILNGNAVKIEERLTKAILNKTIIQKLQEKISEDINEVLETQLEISKLENKQTRLNTKANDKLNETVVKVVDGKIQLTKRTRELSKTIEAQTDGSFKFNKINKEVLKSEGEYFNLKGDASKLDEKINKLKETNTQRQTNINTLIKEALKLTDDYTLELEDNTKSIEERNKATALSIELEKERKRELELAKETLKSLTDLYKDDESFELPKLDSKELERQLADINSRIKPQLQDLFSSDVFQDALGRLSGTIEEFTGVSGAKFKSFFNKIAQGGIDSFEEIADVAAASFDLIGDVANSFYDSKIQGYENDLTANEEYYSRLLENDNLTEEERTRIEKDRQDKEDEILKKKKKAQREQAVAQKAFSIADIILNTARGIASAASSVVTLPLVPFIAGIGAAELAVALATPIPKFAEGGVMDKDGLMMINDHSSGRLEVVERDGKLLMTDKKNAIVEGKKGDVIHKDATKYFNNLSNDEILKDVKKHAMIATLQNQNYLIDKFDNKKVISADNANTAKIVKAIKSQKTKFNLNQNISLSDDLMYLERRNNTL